MKTAEAREPIHIGKVVRNALIFKFRDVRVGAMSDDALLEVVDHFFALLDERRIDYLLVGDIALLQYVEGRNSEEIQILLTPSSLECLPELRRIGQDGDFVEAGFDLLTSNPCSTRSAADKHTTLAEDPILFSLTHLP